MYDEFFTNNLDAILRYQLKYKYNLYIICDSGIRW